MAWNANVWPSGEIRGAMATLEPPSHSADQRVSGGVRWVLHQTAARITRAAAIAKAESGNNFDLTGGATACVIETGASSSSFHASEISRSRVRGSFSRQL